MTFDEKLIADQTSCMSSINDEKLSHSWWKEDMLKIIIWKQVHTYVNIHLRSIRKTTGMLKISV